MLFLDSVRFQRCNIHAFAALTFFFLFTLTSFFITATYAADKMDRSADIESMLHRLITNLAVEQTVISSVCAFRYFFRLHFVPFGHRTKNGSHVSHKLLLFVVSYLSAL